MSKKVSILLSILLGISLALLIVCEKMYPEAGVAFTQSLMQKLFQ